MRYLLPVILLLSLLLNIVAVWGFFTYIRYGGSPVGDLRRRLGGTFSQSAPKVPYAQQNAEILACIERGEADSLRVVFLGASITQNWDFERYLPEFRIINRGAGGQLVPSILARYQRDVIDLQPRAVIIKFCSINIRPELPIRVLQDGMSMLVQLAVANGITPIVCTVIPVGKSESRIGGYSVSDMLAGYNEWLRAFAAEHDLHIIDLAAAIADEHGFLPRECSIDPVHLNEKGYRIVSDTVRPVLSDVLAEK